jgi:hypothetical protein
MIVSDNLGAKSEFAGQTTNTTAIPASALPAKVGQPSPARGYPLHDSELAERYKPTLAPLNLPAYALAAGKNVNHRELTNQPTERK